MVGPGHRPHRMRHHQPDESDQAGQRDGHADRDARRGEGEAPGEPDVDAEGRCAVVAEREQVEPPRESREQKRGQQHRDAGRDQNWRRLVAEGAGEPEQERLRSLRREHRLQRDHQRGGERVEDDSQEQRALRHQLAAGAAERIDEDGRAERACARGKLRGQDSEKGRRNAGCGAERGAGREHSE